MAWNPSPEVAVARDAAKKLNADRVVITYTDKQGRIGYASYGETKTLCTQTGRLAEKLHVTAYEFFEDDLP